ncbi:MAG: carboxypeptidase-like regulatory domain-containing protein [Candidatus Angelobacter sp.]
MRARRNISLGYWAAGFLLIFGLAWRADACFVTLATVHVSTNFRVVVQQGSAPIPGIPVAVFDYADLAKSDGETEWKPKPILTLVAGPDGVVDIQNLKPGSYLIETKGPGAGSAVNAEVSAKRVKGSNRITLEWPFSSDGILKTRALTGQLTSNNPWIPFQDVHVELWTAGAKTPISAENTGAEGHFHFEQTTPGIYILHVRGQQKGVGDNWQVEGDIPLELSPSAVNLPEVLSLQLAESSCGISYSSCPAPNVVAMTSRRIRVRDPLGAVIAHAEYELDGPSSAMKAHGSTDSNGIAELPPDLLGKMTLVIASPGFTLLKQPLDLLAPDGRANDLLVSMAVNGFDNQCSSVTLEKHATP